MPVRRMSIASHKVHLVVVEKFRSSGDWQLDQEPRAFTPQFLNKNLKKKDF